jgi:hypothetical protein
MEKVCPECNKLGAENFKCSSCGGNMYDLGRGQEVFQDDYTANMPINDAVSYCVHVFRCNKCGNNEYKQVSKIII